MSTNSPKARPVLRLVNTDALPATKSMPRRHTGVGGSGGGGGEAKGRRPARLRDLYSSQETSWEIGESIIDPSELNEAQSRRTTQRMSPSDARWVFAVRVASALETGVGGALAPERREKLIRFAKAMGLRPFDANLVIAIVQDAARTSPLAKMGTPAAALHDNAVMDRLTMVPPAGSFDDAGGPRIHAALLQAFVAVAVGAGVCVAMVSMFFG